MGWVSHFIVGSAKDDTEVAHINLVLSSFSLKRTGIYLIFCENVQICIFPPIHIWVTLIGQQCEIAY